MKLKIKKETLAKRCEICHKMDEYEPETDYCSRCNEPLVFTEETISEIENMSCNEQILSYPYISLPLLRKLSLEILFLIVVISFIPLIVGFVTKVISKIFLFAFS